MQCWLKGLGEEVKGTNSFAGQKSSGDTLHQGVNDLILLDHTLRMVMRANVMLHVD